MYSKMSPTLPTHRHGRKPSTGSLIARRFMQPPKVAAAVIIILIIYLFTSSGGPVSTTTTAYNTATTAIANARKGKDSTPPNGRIAIVTFTTEQKSFTHLSLKNHVHYAKMQNYDFIVDYEQHNPIGAMWHKFVMIEDAIATGKYDWIWWMDFDTLITNTTKPLTEVIDFGLENKTNPDDIDFIMTPDCFELNAGSFITRAHPRSVQFFDAVRAYHKANATYEHQLSEQDCMRDIIFKSSEFDDRVTMVPQWMINAFPEEIKCWDKTGKHWERGMLAIHFAGAWAHLTEEDPTGYLMRKYERSVIWGHDTPR